MTDNKAKGELFIVAAPSGAGKTTLVNEVIKRLSTEFDISKVITSTTRTPRPGEVNGKDYFFMSIQKFEEKLKNGYFLETTKYNGQLYGSPSSILSDLELGKSFIVVTDLLGVKEFKKVTPHAKFFWITAPSLEVLKERLLKRKTIENNHVEKRLKLAEEEMKEGAKSRLFNFNVVNDVFDQTVAEICLLIKNELTK